MSFSISINSYDGLYFSKFKKFWFESQDEIKLQDF